MSRSYTLQGQYGTIPYDEYLRKIQQSAVIEDPDQFEKYARKQLVDYKPDAPFFESDQIRDPNDRGSGNGSRERLALRHSGARSEESPDLPDGTFLDHEFTERDPRGALTGPDFNAGRKQREARGKFIKFSNDNDYSVMETGVNPVQMVSAIRGAQQQVKDRLQNFDESMDSWHNGSAAKRGENSTVAQTTLDGTVVNLADASQEQREDPVNVLSNRTPAMLRLTSPDHRVKVSKYGVVRPTMDVNYNAWNTNRYNAYLDHQIPIEINGQMVNRQLAMMILDIEGQRATKQAAAVGANYEESMNGMVRNMQLSINPEDLYKMIMINMTSSSQPATANQQLSGQNAPRKAKFTGDLRTVLNASDVNHAIVQSMMQSNREIGPQRRQDLRTQVAQSASDYGLYTESANHGATALVRNTLVREGLNTRDIEDAKTTKVYSSIKPMQAMLHDVVDIEAFAKNSRETQERNSNTKKMRNRSTLDSENDLDMEEFNLPGARKTHAKSQYEGRNTKAEFGDIIRKDTEDAKNIHDTLYNMILAA